jgi:DNA-binding winged helix-turn-helix (wHTH) protein
MSLTPLRFGDFRLDPGNRRLLRGEAEVALNARYFDALVLLVREHGRLVGKQRFFDEVWAGSVVTDAALTQCIKELRRALGDDASAPRFVRTVPGHGYRFIAAVESVPMPAAVAAAGQALDPPDALAVASLPAPAEDAPPRAAGVASRLDARWRGLAGSAVAAALGGAAAGLFGGVLYGSLLAFSPQAQRLGSLSVLLVLLALSMLVGVLGGLGVGLGLGLGRLSGPGVAPPLLGAALGGLVVGGMARMLGSDAFVLLVGAAPAGITGGLEGALIGLAFAAGWLSGGGEQAREGWRPALFAALATGLACALLVLGGGHLMAGSLAGIAATFEASRLDPAQLGRLFGDQQFSHGVQVALAALEGVVFGACVAAALALAGAPPGAHRR